ncbi:hepcidin-like [Parambassis ranga]|uniref:Hepcidin-like n=1 Tax=Parambassis ranga TaxID=210632 RepID=A0A6P7K0Y8_9TELE|nr:hepcidin-like [Parambassis ranga]
MKPISVAVAVAVVLTVVCIQQSSAMFFEGQDLEVEMKNDHSLGEQEQESAMGHTTMVYSYDPKQVTCRYCCGCCFMPQCGVCCTKVIQESKTHI